MLEMFYAHGMDIGRRMSRVGDRACLDPLWNLAFCQDQNGLNILAVMLEHGLPVRSAEAMVGHVLLDMEMFDGCELTDAHFADQTVCALKMILLAASYPHIIEGSEYIRECIDLAHNQAQRLPAFRAWNDFTYHIDQSTCDNLPDGLRNATLTIRDIRTGDPVWKFAI